MLASGGSRRARWLALGAGCAVALLVGVSRVVVGAHSVSEVMAGLLVGGIVSAGALSLAQIREAVLNVARYDIDGLREYGIGRFPVVPMRRVAHDIGAEPGIVTTGGSLDETAEDVALMAELDALAKALEHPARPLLAIVAGSKVSTKLTILKSLADKVDGLVVGGGIANTFMLAAGLPIGKSLAEPDLLAEARAVMAAMKARGAEVRLVPWEDARRRPERGELVVLRSTWNYYEDVDGFLAWDFDADTAATFFAQQVLYTMLFLSFL